MDTILQPSPTKSREDHMISDDIIENVIEVRMIVVKVMSLQVTLL